MRMSKRSRSWGSLIITAGCVVSAVLVPSAQAQSASTASTRFRGLNLGAAGLVETRTDSRVQAGVTLTVIHRGKADPRDFWSLELVDTVDAPDPDPDAAAPVIFSQVSAETQAALARAAGFPARVEAVAVPPTADFAPGILGYRVRVGHFDTKTAATVQQARVAAAGFTASSTFTGWDGAATDRGPWNVQVLTIDPHKFHGSIKTSFGPDIERRETTSQLSADDHAAAAVNAGYFVLNPAAGAPGDPAGVGVYRGALLSEPTNGLPGLVLHSDARNSTIERFGWRGTVSAGGMTLTLHGVDRVPGLVRNCGGQPGDLPTALAQHDVTCIDPDDAVLLTGQFGAKTPAGVGSEIVVDRAGRILSIAANRGTILLQGQRSIQLTGRQVVASSKLAVGERLRIKTELTDSRSGKTVPLAPDTYIANGGPMLLADGHLDVTPLQDGLVIPAQPSRYYGFAAKRNPRTVAGTNAHGELVLITADGRSTQSLGLSITEAADVAQSLGLTEAMNLDGGGSTTMVVHNKVVNTPSDATGERPVGDAVLIDPARP